MRLPGVTRFYQGTYFNTYVIHTCLLLLACTDLVQNKAARYLVPRYGVCYTFNFGPIYQQVTDLHL
jgi:hypothetical protein